MSELGGVHSPLLEVDGRLGKDRRRFIVLSIFDFSFTVLLWLICTVAKGDNWTTVFLHEINIFSADFWPDSLFDVVLIVLLRMVLLIVAYAVMRQSHWVPVALTTGISSAFLLVKVLFFFSHKTGQLPQFILVLSAFIVGWVELWFMPFRVLQRERESRPSRVPSSPVSRPVIAFSDDDFRSALEFSSESEYEENVGPSGRHSKKSKAQYAKIAEETERTVLALLSECHSWKAIRQSAPLIRQSDAGAFYLKAYFTCKPQVLWTAVWKDNLKWNDQVLDAKVVLKVDDSTVLFYSISAPAMRGYVASRDFLDVRTVREDERSGTYSGYFRSVDSNILPPSKNQKIVRGTNGPSMMRVCESGDGSCLEWLMQTHLNGGLPRRIVLSSMLTFFVNNINKLEQYIHSLHNV